MDPRWHLSESAVWTLRIATKVFELLNNHDQLWSITAGFAFLTLAGGLIARFWSCLPETSPFEREVTSYFRKAIQFLSHHCVPGLLLAGTLATAIAVHVRGLHWKDAVDVLLQISLTSSIVQGLSLIATVERPHAHLDRTRTFKAYARRNPLRPGHAHRCSQSA